MTALKFSAQGLSVAVVTALAACSSNQTPQAINPQVSNAPVAQPISGSHTVFNAPKARAMQSADQIVNDFRQFESILNATKQGNDVAAQQFLARQSQSAMGESVRNEWLKSLGKRGQAQWFTQEYAKLDKAGRDKETLCYAHLFGIDRQSNEFINDLVETTGKLPEGCNVLLQNLAQQNTLNPSRAWRRVRGLISNGHTTDAGNLAEALGSPLNSASGYGWQENLLRDIISPSAQKSPDFAAARLQSVSGSLNREQSGFAWGVLGLVHAKNQNMASALQYYRQAERSQLNNEQFEWYARAALRLQQWNELANIIQSMPSKLQQDPTWQYWLGRSLAAQGNRGAAQNLYQQAAQSGRNFYALLATEELGQRVNTRNNVGATPAANVQKLAQDGAIHRALSLYHTSKQEGNWKMRRQAQAEWRYATRGMNEATLLAAAELAHQHEFYEMAINSAERTDHLLNYNLRYLTPFRDLVVSYGNQNGVDPAWVYGLIRQESRFVMGAQSGVGAQGLMQVMPATAREIASKIGMDSSELYTMNGNIRMGTWYMADARRRLQNNEVLATAGYNAGPGRARKWQAGNSLEGAIYAETIPFNETRDYVKKVMTNAVYYASLLNEPQTSLKQRMGIVPAN
ncbi:transglycosylase SLT domain-containing protein [Neisseriaceae bacterium B1]